MRQSRRPVASSLILSPMSSVFFDGASSAILFPADIPLDKAAPLLSVSVLTFSVLTYLPRHIISLRGLRGTVRSKRVPVNKSTTQGRIIMKCTSCKQGNLIPAYLDYLFPCHTCSHCAGNLVMLSDYLHWLEDNENPDFVQASDAVVKAEETASAMLCPKTKVLMLKYKISQHNDHRLDLSPAINAVWLDKGEWELLKQEGLAGKLNEIFTDSWQRSIRAAKTSETLALLYEKKFGANYEKIKEFKTLLAEMENKSEVIAYLISDDPYKA